MEGIGPTIPLAGVCLSNPLSGPYKLPVKVLGRRCLIKDLKVYGPPGARMTIYVSSAERQSWLRCYEKAQPDDMIPFLATEHHGHHLISSKTVW